MSDMMEQVIEDIKNGTLPPLDTRLAPYVVLEGIPRIQHPLMHVLFYSPAQNRMYNMGFHQKVRAFKSYRKHGEWMCLLNLIERPFRIPVFAKYRNYMSDEDYWSCLAWVYTDSENIDQHLKLMKSLLRSKRGGREHMMDEDDRAALAAMPETITVYKGFSDDYSWKSDCSFSTELRVAKFFAQRYGCTTPHILTAEIPKDKVIAYMTNRNEQEILIEPKYAKVLHNYRLKRNAAAGGFAAAIHQQINRVS